MRLDIVGLVLPDVRPPRHEEAVAALGRQRLSFSAQIETGIEHPKAPKARARLTPYDCNDWKVVHNTDAVGMCSGLERPTIGFDEVLTHKAILVQNALVVTAPKRSIDPTTVRCPDRTSPEVERMIVRVLIGVRSPEDMNEQLTPTSVWHQEDARQVERIVVPAANVHPRTKPHSMLIRLLPMTATYRAKQIIDHLARFVGGEQVGTAAGKFVVHRHALIAAHALRERPH